MNFDDDVKSNNFDLLPGITMMSMCQQFTINSLTLTFHRPVKMKLNQVRQQAELDRQPLEPTAQDGRLMQRGSSIKSVTRS